MDGGVHIGKNEVCLCSGWGCVWKKIGYMCMK